MAQRQFRQKLSLPAVCVMLSPISALHGKGSVYFSGIMCVCRVYTLFSQIAALKFPCINEMRSTKAQRIQTCTACC